MPAQNRHSEVETELKIKLSQRDLERVFRNLSQREGTSDVTHKYLPRLYYDTERLDLYKRKLSLRVQYKRGKEGRLGAHEQTVKIEMTAPQGLDAGVRRRKECKDKVKSHKPDLSALTDKTARSALMPVLRGKKLKHIFTAAIERRYFNWDLEDGKRKGIVEVAFDVGQIILPHNNKHRNFFEIELEIKAGESQLIDIVWQEIKKIAPKARIQRLSKSDQGSLFYLAHRK